MDILKLVEDRKKELTPLYDRMDETRDLVYLTPYELKNFKGRKIDNAVSITMNDPAVFVNAIISDLMGAKWQTVIEGNISDKQKHLIENFIDDNRAQADEQLAKRGIAGLFAWLCNHVCIRSLIGVRWLSWMDKDTYRLDGVPVDMRYTPFEYGRDDLDWVAPETTRSKRDIKAEYDIDLRANEASVIDFWDGEQNVVFIDRKEVEGGGWGKHKLGYPPFVIISPASGFMLRDKGYLEHEAEDILFLNRGLYEEKNRSASIEQTLGMDILFPPYEQEVEAMDGKPGEPPPKSGESKRVLKGERHVPVPRGDLNRASLKADQKIEKALQLGGVNDIDLGNVSQTVSAVWITEQSEIRNKIVRPRLQALAMFYQGLARMMIDQYIKNGEKAKRSEFSIGIQGKKRQYSPAQLGDPEDYTIAYELMSRSKKQEIANWAVANAAWGKAPRRVIFSDILQVDDPDGWIRELEIEEARNADPAIALFEMALRYAEEAENLKGEDAEAKKIQSMMLTERGVYLIRQRTMGQPVPEKVKTPKTETPKGNAGALMPFIGATGVTGGAPQVERAVEEKTGGD
jgi:hypothetical protein